MKENKKLSKKYFRKVRKLHFVKVIDKAAFIMSNLTALLYALVISPAVIFLANEFIYKQNMVVFYHILDSFIAGIFVLLVVFAVVKFAFFFLKYLIGKIYYLD